MRQLAKDIDGFLNEVILQAENQHEILIGHCTSEVALTNTQEHILMLLSEESLTNSELARRLNVSQAAVTKAIKSLVKEGMLETSKDPKDARVIFYQLTDLARPIAEEHHHHHDDHDRECGHEHHHHGHHADEVFDEMGVETAHRFTRDRLEQALAGLMDPELCGQVLRAKGFVAGTDGEWYEFDYVPGEPEIRVAGEAEATGVICVIGVGLNKDKIKELFGI